MTECYFELRKSSARGTDSITADVMRHFHTRQHLGKAIIICAEPPAIMGAARKQWLKLSRSLQKRRSSTLNADKILKYTHAVTRMQRMHFTAKNPLERPDADIYFVSPDNLAAMPVHCWSVYILSHLSTEVTARILRDLPNDTLIIDYLQSPKWETLGLRPKKVLESNVSVQWRQVERFLQDFNIDIGNLVVDEVHNIEAMDDALDTLLGGHGHKFLQVANEFQRALELARPLRLSKNLRVAYDSLALLAHRVQALSPGAFSQHFLEIYNEDDTFFLYDPSGRLKHKGTEALAEAFARHTNAGRHHLARSLQLLAET